MEGTLPFQDFVLVLNTFYGTRPMRKDFTRMCNTLDGTQSMTVLLVSDNSTKLEIDSLLLCVKEKILGSRPLEPATNSALVRLVFILDEALKCP